LILMTIDTIRQPLRRQSLDIPSCTLRVFKPALLRKAKTAHQVPGRAR
jgi:hypothetical protein